MSETKVGNLGNPSNPEAPRAGLSFSQGDVEAALHTAETLAKTAGIADATARNDQVRRLAQSGEDYLASLEVQGRNAAPLRLVIDTVMLGAPKETGENYPIKTRLGDSELITDEQKSSLTQMTDAATKLRANGVGEEQVAHEMDRQVAEEQARLNGFNAYDGNDSYRLALQSFRAGVTSMSDLAGPNRQRLIESMTAQAQV